MYCIHYGMDVNTPNTDMAKKITERPKERVQAQFLQMRVSKEFLELIDDYRRRQTPIPGRTEVVRSIVESALRKGLK